MVMEVSGGKKGMETKAEVVDSRVMVMEVSGGGEKGMKT